MSCRLHFVGLTVGLIFGLCYRVPRLFAPRFGIVRSTLLPVAVCPCYGRSLGEVCVAVVGASCFSPLFCICRLGLYVCRRLPAFSVRPGAVLSGALRTCLSRRAGVASVRPRL